MTEVPARHQRMGEQVREGLTVGGRYYVQGLLGKGGLGEVWEALDGNLRRPVAIKFVTGVMLYPDDAGRFAREARTLAALNHDSVVTVHDAGTIDHDGHALPYVVMELLNGLTWETAQVDSVIKAGARLAGALAYIHAAKIVHRDIKPANIMICTDGRTMLMDFGIARDDKSLTRTATTTGKVFGTPAYMAPEQFQGSAATPASDVYALGLILVEKLTGQRAPASHLTGGARNAIPKHLMSLLARMTSHIPQDRPSAAECALQLRAPATPSVSAPPKRRTLTDVTDVTDASFHTEVLTSAKPVIALFYAKWDGPSRQIVPSLEAIASEYGNQIEIVKIDIDRNQKNAAKYCVMAVPTLNVYVDGEVAKTIVGAKPKVALLHELRDFLDS
ncbi:protein kinase [Streptomyces sp. NBC_01220]|uniref:protein kinase domain-containing protein n=1 Tax=Streptomyces sp. NBC_01220 TaxID=2903781 RepID=UPI00352E1C9C|nr:protein kinase [Streptomyces sp. NBC_01220]